MAFDISLVVLTYNSDLLGTIATLESARMQRGVRFKVVVADDGSSNANLDCLKSYMGDAGFDAYELLGGEANVGTVRNLAKALDYVDSPYVKPISPGDYLYGRDSLRAISDAMHGGDLALCFGRAVYYRTAGDAVEVLRYRNPLAIAPYTRQRTSARTIKRNQIRYRDCILGASAAYRTEDLRARLNLLAENPIRLCEDFSMQLMLMDESPYAFINKNLLWYEYGTGVSTGPLNEANGTMQLDARNMVDLLYRRYPQDSDVRALKRRVEGLGDADAFFRLRRAARDPGSVLFLLERRLLRLTAKRPRADMDSYNVIIRRAREWVGNSDVARLDETGQL